MKAHGVPALIRHIRGEITRDEASEIGRADTRHYAKRQFTWFRHQLPEFEWVKPEAAGDGLHCRISDESESDQPSLGVHRGAQWRPWFETRCILRAPDYDERRPRMPANPKLPSPNAPKPAKVL